MPKKNSPSKGARARVRNPPTLKDCRVAVVGLNALGYRIAQLLVSSGVRTLKLFDHRLVTKRDQLQEGYDAIDIGRPKAHAAVQRCHEINSRIDITGCTSRPAPDSIDADIVVICGTSVRKRHRESDPMAWIHILGCKSGEPSIRIDCSDTTSLGDQNLASSKCLHPAEAFIIAGVAARQVIRSRSGNVLRDTQRIQIDGLTIRICP